LRRLV